MLHKRGQIKTHHHARKFTAKLFCEQGQIKTKHRQKTLLQNYSVEMDELSSTEEDKSECTTIEQKDADNEITYDVPYNFNVSNVFECIINNPDVLYKRAYMATERDEYFTEMIDHKNEYNDRH